MLRMSLCGNVIRGAGSKESGVVTAVRPEVTRA